MKTTIELPDDLYRRAKAEAALRGRKLKDLVEEGLRLVLVPPAETTFGETLGHSVPGESPAEATNTTSFLLKVES